MLRSKCSIDDLKRILNCLNTPDWLPTLLKHQSIIDAESNISKLSELLFMVITKISVRYYFKRKEYGFLSTNTDYISDFSTDLNALFDIYGNRLQHIVKDYLSLVQFIAEAKKTITNLDYISSDWIITNLLKRVSVVQTADHLAGLLKGIDSASSAVRTELIAIVHAHWEIEYRKACRMIFLSGSKDPGSALFKLFHNQYSLTGSVRGIEVGVIKKIFDYANFGPYHNSENGISEKGYSIK